MLLEEVIVVGFCGRDLEENEEGWRVSQLDIWETR